MKRKAKETEFNTWCDMPVNNVRALLEKLDRICAEYRCDVFLFEDGEERSISAQEAKQLQEVRPGRVDWEADIPYMVVIDNRAMEFHIVLTSLVDHVSESCELETTHHIYSIEKNGYYQKVTLMTPVAQSQMLAIARINGAITAGKIYGTEESDKTQMPGLSFKDEDLIPAYKVNIAPLYDSFNQSRRVTPGCECSRCALIKSGEKIGAKAMGEMNSIAQRFVDLTGDMVHMSKTLPALLNSLTTGRRDHFPRSICNRHGKPSTAPPANSNRVLQQVLEINLRKRGN